MSLYDRFRETKEEGFRDNFIRPLLIQMGYLGISNKHGSQEFGKDYVFSELDGFGQFRHLIVQAKHEETINQGRKVDDLLSQVKQCFYVPYTLPSAPTEERYVSAVYVFNTGEITPNAETQIRHALPREMASNTRIFSGNQLEAIANVEHYRQTRHIRERLSALKRQLEVNIHIWTSLRSGIDPQSADQTFDVRGPILHGIEEFLSLPILPTEFTIGLVFNVWERAKIIHQMSMKHYMAPFVTPEAKTKDLTLLQGLCEAAIRDATLLIAALNLVLQNLPPSVV